MDISANQTLNIAKVCLGYSPYDVQLPDIYVSNFILLLNSNISQLVLSDHFKSDFVSLLKSSIA